MANEAYHEIRISGREKAAFTAVTEVSAFDDKSVVMETSLGTLHIEGTGLSVTKLDLDSGEAAIDGKINGVFYMENRAGKRRRRRGED